MNIIKIIRPIIILVVLGVGGYFGYQYYSNNIAETIDPNVIETSGVVEAIEVRVGTKIAGPISELYVEEGDQVPADQLIARIDTIDIQLQIDTATAQVEQARSMYHDTLKGMRPEEIKRLKQIVATKKALYEQAEIDYNTKKELADKKVAAKYSADLAYKAMLAAQSDYETAQEQVEIASLGSRNDQIKAAQYALEQANANLNQLKQKLVDSEIKAPISGRVSIKNMERGEIAKIGSTIVTLIDLERPWVRMYVPEHKLGRIKLGMEAEIISDSFPDKKYFGIVRYISPEAEFTPKNVQTQEERIKLVYALKIYLDNPDQELKPGMPVDAIIRLEEGK